MWRSFYIVLLSVLLIAGDVAAQGQTTKSIKHKKETTQKEINETNKKIKSNTAQTKRSLNQLNLIEAEISSHKKNVDKITRELASINKRLNLLNDSIAATEKEIAQLKDNYSRAIRAVHARSTSFDRMLFVFSASSFKQAYRRMRYLRQFSMWREKQTEEIKKMQTRLIEQHAKVEAFYKQRSATLAKQNQEKLGLEKKRKQQAEVVASLKQEGNQLKRILAEKQRLAKQLDDELNRLIAEEERKAAERARQEEEKRRAEEKKKQEEQGKQPADDKKVEKKEEAKPAPTPSSGYNMDESERKLSGSFEENKGNLLFPVSGDYKIVRPFGRQKHPELKYVETDNNGIDIEVPAGTKARAVFDGKVSAVFRQDGFNKVVMVRHGNYLTIYVNLVEIYVKTGDAVKANQPIGLIFSDKDDDNRTILHFEVRKEREKLNPELWVK